MAIKQLLTVTSEQYEEIRQGKTKLIALMDDGTITFISSNKIEDSVRNTFVRWMRANDIYNEKMGRYKKKANERLTDRIAKEILRHGDDITKEKEEEIRKSMKRSIDIEIKAYEADLLKKLEELVNQ